jgi:hypothetical protein
MPREEGTPFRRTLDFPNKKKMLQTLRKFQKSSPPLCHYLSKNAWRSYQLNPQSLPSSSIKADFLCQALPGIAPGSSRYQPSNHQNGFTGSNVCKARRYFPDK